MPTPLPYTPDQQRFIDAALAAIPNSPLDRLNPPARAVLDRNNYVFDAHSHVFDGGCVEADYVIVRMLNLEERTLGKVLVTLLVKFILDKKYDMWKHLTAREFIDAIWNKRAEGSSLFAQADLDKLTKGLRTDKFPLINPIPGWQEIKSRLADLLDILRDRDMAPVYDYFVKNAIHHQFSNPPRELISVQLGMDLGAGWREGQIKTFQQQTDELLALSLTEPILPYLPVHPKRAAVATTKPGGFNELYDTFIEKFSTPGNSYFGIKCYPALGYLPSDIALAPIFEVCAAKNIPVLSHCGGTIISTFDKVIEANRFGKKETIEQGSRVANAAYLNYPNNWKEVLEQFPQLRLCLAHFGGDEAWKESARKPEPRIQAILHLMNACDNVYADFSFNIKDKKAREVFAKYLNSADPAYAKVKERTLFGTDSWVVADPFTDLHAAQNKFLALTQAHHARLFITNVTQYLGLNL